MTRVCPKQSLNIMPVVHGATVRVSGGTTARMDDGTYMISLDLTVGGGVYLPCVVFASHGEALAYINEAKKTGLYIA